MRVHFPDAETAEQFATVLAFPDTFDIAAKVEGAVVVIPNLDDDPLLTFALKEAVQDSGGTIEATT